MVHRKNRVALQIGTFLATIMYRGILVLIVLLIVLCVNPGGMNMIDIPVFALVTVSVILLNILTLLMPRFVPLGAILVMMPVLSVITCWARPAFLELATFRIRTWSLSPS